MLPYFFIHLFILLASTMVLSKASHIVINSSIKIAKITKLGEMVIGFLVLSVATSIPEFAVAFSAITSGDVGITIGDILGSNVTNIALVIGIAAVITPISVTWKALKDLSTILLLSSLIPLLLLINAAHINKMTGVLLILVYFIFAFYSVKRRITLEKIKVEPKTIIQRIFLPLEYYKTILVLCIGLFGVIFSARFVVDSASFIAESLGVAKPVVGAIFVAVGTSLPEIAMSISSVRNKRVNLALGNTIGSCLVNLTLILGLVLATSTFSVNLEIFSVLLTFVILVTLVARLFLTTGRIISRREGIVLLLIYMIFFAITFYTQAVVVS